MVMIKSDNQTINKVESKKYKDNWDRIFGGKEPKQSFKYSGVVEVIENMVSKSLVLEDTSDNIDIISKLKVGKKYKITLEEI